MAAYASRFNDLRPFSSRRCVLNSELRLRIQYRGGSGGGDFILGWDPTIVVQEKRQIKFSLFGGESSPEILQTI